MQLNYLVLVLLAAPAAAQATATHPVKLQPRVLWKVPLDSTCFGSGAVADVDGDGRLEVAFATYFGDSKVRVLNGEDGSEVWTWRGRNQCLDASLRFCDLDGDGRLELVVPVSNSSWVLCFDARTGEQRWRYEAGPGECIDTPPAVVDVTGDGKPEILVGTFKGAIHIVGPDGKRVARLPVAPGAVQSGVVAIDLAGDGNLALLAANFRGDHALHAVHGRTGKELWRVQTGSHMYHGVSLGDIDGDRKPDFAIASYDGKVYAFDHRGAKIWTVEPGDRYFMSPTVRVDVDGDGREEVVVASESLTAIGSKGQLLYSERLSSATGCSVTRGVSVADLDGDGGVDLVTLDSHGVLRVHRGKDGALLCTFDVAKVHGKKVRQGSHGPVIADLDGDGRLDVFVVVGGDNRDRHGLAVCLTGFPGTGEGWYQMRHDAQNTGNVRTPLAPALRANLQAVRAKVTEQMTGRKPTDSAPTRPRPRR
ncbi:MAG: VCBS repeat-containing protein [Planctomycetes bacterium]|nr:VCBS repeat-containing protein [Planctomycetota bacterium]